MAKTEATYTIKLLVEENPKRGASAARFALYRNGITVDGYIKKSVEAGNDAQTARADLRWDVSHKFIALQKRAS
jgi:hypothetical protein